MSDTNLIYLGGMAAIGLAAAFAWRLADRLGAASIVVRALILYLCGAHLLKGWLLYHAGWLPAVETGVVPRTLTANEDVLVAELVVVYSLSVIGACILLLQCMPRISAEAALASAPLRADEDALRRILWVLAALLPYKFLINHVMRWGVPALVPTNTIPLVTGVSVYLVRDAMLCLCAAALYQGFVRLTPSNRLLRRLTIVASLGYVGLDLGMGSKFAMLGMLFAGISLTFRALLLQDARSRVKTVLWILGVFLVFLPTYQIANVLRFISLDNALSLLDLASRTADKVDLDWVNVVFAVLGRATGAEGIAAAVVLDGRLGPGILDIFLSMDFGPRYTFALSGIGADNVAFGATLAGTYSLMCRESLACVGTWTAVVTFLLMGALLLLISSIRVKPAASYGVATSLALVAVHAQLASGGIVVFAQRILVIVVAGWLIDRAMSLDVHSILRRKSPLEHRAAGG